MDWKLPVAAIILMLALLGNFLNVWSPTAVTRTADASRRLSIVALIVNGFILYAILN